MSENSPNPESVLEKVTADSEPHFGGRKFRRLRKSIEYAWFQLSPDKALARFKELQKSNRRVTMAIAHDFLRQGRFEDAVAVRPTHALDFRFWMNEVGGHLTELASSDVYFNRDVSAVMQDERYLRTVRMIELINSRRHQVRFEPDRAEEQKEIADAGMFYANLAWFFFLYHLLYDCLLYTSPSPRDATLSRMPSSA